MLDRRFWRSCVDAWITAKLSKKHLRNGEQDYRYVLSDERAAQWGGYYQPAIQTTRLFPWLLANKIHQPTAAHIERYFLALESKGLKLTTINKSLYIIRDFFRYLNDHNIYPNDICNIVAYKLDSDNVHVRENITPEIFLELAKVINTATLNGLRDYAIILIAYTTGARIKSIISLKQNDFVFTKRDNIYKLRIAVKKRRNQELDKYSEIPGFVGMVIHHYLLKLESMNITANNSDPLFISTKQVADKNPLQQTSVSAIIKNYMRKLVDAGVIDKSELKLYVAHSLRHGYMSLINEKFGLYEAGLLGDHKSIETTKRYVHTKSMRTLERNKNYMFTNSIGSKLSNLPLKQMKISA